MASEKDFFTLDDFNLQGKTVLLRVDINSPIDPDSGRILDDTRMRRHLETMNALSGSRLVIMAHQSRPGKSDFTGMGMHAKRLSSLLNRHVEYVDDLFGSRARQSIGAMHAGDILLLENTRLYSEEVVLKGEPLDIQAKSHVVRKLSPLIDYFVNDAFAAAHRSQPSLVGFATSVPSLAGRVMERELTKLGNIMSSQERPKIAILGGAKIDDSIEVMKHMLDDGIMDEVLTCGVVGTIFLMAGGVAIGGPNIDFLKREIKGYEKLVDDAKALLAAYPERIEVPTDVALNDNGERVGITVDMPIEHPIFDIGLDTAVHYRNKVLGARNVLLNGPAGVFELEEFSIGTRELLSAMAETQGYTVLGGGHSIAIARKMGIDGRLDHLSTGGGALIRYLSGKKMPVIEALRDSRKLFS